MSQVPHNGLDHALIQIRFDYAWRYFSLHARQRVAMFNFFLLASGILVSAYGLLLREQFYWQAGCVAIVGLVVSLVSIGLDVRNHQLVHFGEEALLRLEQDHLLSDTPQSPSANLPEYAIVSRESGSGGSFSFLTKHKLLFRFLEGFVGVAFLAAASYALIVSFVC